MSNAKCDICGRDIYRVDGPWSHVEWFAWGHPAEPRKFRVTTNRTSR